MLNNPLLGINIPSTNPVYCINIGSFRNGTLNIGYYIFNSSGSFQQYALTSTNNPMRVYLPVKSIIQKISVFTFARSVAGSSEPINLIYRLNGVSEHILDTISSTNKDRLFEGELNILLDINEYIEVGLHCTSAFVTPPSVVYFSGFIKCLAI